MSFTLVKGRSYADIGVVCIGSGRFIRSVLLPALESAGQGDVLVIQPRRYLTHLTQT